MNERRPSDKLLRGMEAVVFCACCEGHDDTVSETKQASCVECGEMCSCLGCICDGSAA